LELYFDAGTTNVQVHTCAIGIVSVLTSWAVRLNFNIDTEARRSVC
jgi:hypothetical protein